MRLPLTNASTRPRQLTLDRLDHEHVIARRARQLAEISHGDPSPTHAGRMLAHACERGLEVRTKVRERDLLIRKPNRDRGFVEPVSGDLQRLEGRTISGQSRDRITLESTLA